MMRRDSAIAILFVVGAVGITTVMLKSLVDSERIKRFSTTQGIVALSELHDAQIKLSENLTICRRVSAQADALKMSGTLSEGTTKLLKQSACGETVQ